MDQPPLENGDGPIGLVMVPTRELAMQVYREVRKFMVPVGLAVSVIFGGSNVKQQIAELKRCPEVTRTRTRTLTLTPTLTRTRTRWSCARRGE